MRYPKECPVFEIRESGAHFDYGTIVEGFGPVDVVPGLFVEEIPGYLACRLVRGAMLASDEYRAKCHRILGFEGCAVDAEILRPLTPAAVDMLALVTQ